MTEFEIPAWIILDGENRPFTSSLKFDGEFAIQETDENPIPESLKNGLTCIVDIWIPNEMIPGEEYNLN